MSDLISRQEAIDALNDEFTIIGKTNAVIVQDYIRRVNNRLRSLPSAQPERKTGEWLELTNTNHTYVCSVCGRMLVNITDGKNTVTKNYPFCHCGADMRGEQNG